MYFIQDKEVTLKEYQEENLRFTFVSHHTHKSSICKTAYFQSICYSLPIFESKEDFEANKHKEIAFRTTVSLGDYKELRITVLSMEDYLIRAIGQQDNPNKEDCWQEVIEDIYYHDEENPLEHFDTFQERLLDYLNYGKDFKAEFLKKLYKQHRPKFFARSSRYEGKRSQNHFDKLLNRATKVPFHPSLVPTLYEKALVKAFHANSHLYNKHIANA